MAKDYRPVDRDQQFLVPPDMREWLPAHHLAWFLLEVVEGLDTSSLHSKSRRGGTGRQGYDPDMLLGLWFYGYARGISSSRQIERLCSEDVAFRVLCGQDVPDHTVLSRFRQVHEDAMADLFTRVLVLCVSHGLGRFGMIAIDGTKIRANASKDKTVSLTRLRKLAVAEMKKAEATDAAEDAAGAPAARDDVPTGLGSGSDRKSRIAEAIRQVEELIEQENAPIIQKLENRVKKAVDALAVREAEHRARQEAYEKARADGARTGRPPVKNPVKLQRARDAVPYAEKLVANARKKKLDQSEGAQVSNRKLAQRNTTDPESRVMKTRGGYEQAFNAQLAVTDDHLVMVAEVTDQVGDVRQLVPMMDHLMKAIAACAESTDRTDLQIGMITADNGYLSDENVAAPGPGRLIAPGRGKIRDEKWVSTLKVGREVSAAAAVMLEKLKDPENQALYKRRSVTVEPVNAHVKVGRGLRQFSRRGLKAADAELKLAAMATNLMKLFTVVWVPAQMTA